MWGMPDGGIMSDEAREIDRRMKLANAASEWKYMAGVSNEYSDPEGRTVLRMSPGRGIPADMGYYENLMRQLGQR